MPTLPTTPERDWEKEFDKRLGYSFIDSVIRDCEKSDKDLLTEMSKHIKQFISTELQAKATELLGEVEKIIGDDENSWVDKFGYHSYPEGSMATRNELRAEQRKQLASLRSKWERK